MWGQKGWTCTRFYPHDRVADWELWLTATAPHPESVIPNTISLGHDQNSKFGELPSGPVVRAPCFHCMGHGFDPWSGN